MSSVVSTYELASISTPDDGVLLFSDANSFQVFKTEIGREIEAKLSQLHGYFGVQAGFMDTP